ncbi:hypothetical protein [Devosia sp. DBB001]|nr:hypothetical protein [Devosia sp. DBB001]
MMRLYPLLVTVQQLIQRLGCARLRFMNRLCVLATLATILFTPPAFAFHPNIEAVNPADVISITDATEAEAVRSDLRAQIFGSESLNTSLIPIVESDYMDAVWATKQNLAGMKVLRIPMSLGVNSKAWRFTPITYRNANGGKCGFIVVAGHGQVSVFPPYMALIEKLLYAGCEVTAIDMPFSGQNPAATVDTGRGRVLIQHHGNIQAAQTKDFHPLRWFVEAPLAIVNDYTSRGITNIGITGLSGGGWTADVYAALDERVTVSYSIAGSMPMYMRSWIVPNPPASLGDWEQMAIRPLGVGYLDLYVLGSIGLGRRHVNIYIVNDDCCFGGYNANHFAPAVSAAVESIELGSYGVVFDTTVSTHTISPWAASWIVTDMANYL